jgi:hypothetical protein
MLDQSQSRGGRREIPSVSSVSTLHDNEVKIQAISNNSDISEGYEKQIRSQCDLKLSHTVTLRIPVSTSQITPTFQKVMRIQDESDQNVT